MEKTSIGGLIRETSGDALTLGPVDADLGRAFRRALDLDLGQQGEGVDGRGGPAALHPNDPILVDDVAKTGRRRGNRFDELLLGRHGKKRRTARGGLWCV
jgi:hypothetical protein